MPERLPEKIFTPTFRCARTGDIPAMQGLLETLFTLEADFRFDADKQRRGLHLLLSDANGKIWVAEAERRVVGMCSVQLLISTAEGGRVGLIEDLVVAEGWRGRGIGSGLLRTAELWAREQGLSRLQLLADRNNAPALSFYRRLAWHTTDLVALRKLLA